MQIPENLTSRLVEGLLSDVRQAPWLSLSVGALWVGAWLIFIFVYPTLAMTADVKRTDEKVEIVLRVVLEQDLKDLVKAQCDAPSAWWTIEKKINEQKAEYEQTLGRAWTKLSCEEARR